MTRVSSEPLTPEHVRWATFSSARLGRRGLDEGEVRAFCGQVSDELGRLHSSNTVLQEEVLRLRRRVLDRTGKPGVRPEDGHVQAVNLLSKAQQTAERCVAEAQDFSRVLAQDARMRSDEILREAKVRASIILDEAHASASKAANAVPDTRESLPGAEHRELQAEIAYLRTFSDVCRTHLRAYMESLTRSIEQWERAEQESASAARASVQRSSQEVLSQWSVKTPPPYDCRATPQIKVTVRPSWSYIGSSPCQLRTGTTPGGMSSRPSKKLTISSTEWMYSCAAV